jgi:serine/threonine protein kinase
MPPLKSVDNHPKSKGNTDDSRQVQQTDDQPVRDDLPRAFGRLTLLKQIARGGMGEVYLAATGGIEGTERPCVVKIIRRDHAGDQSFTARFLDEARIQSQLGHPGVAQVLEAMTDAEGKAYIVMEYVEGRNLSELRHRAASLGVRIAWPDAVAIGILLTEALAHVHERTDPAGRPLEIAHRDLSPQNVMVSYGGELKIIDFGTARGQNRRCHTVAGVVFAKPGYVAPEVANNQPGGAPADLYAFGIMLWELVASRRFLSGEPADHLAAVAAGQRKVAPLGKLVDAPAKLDSILRRLTAYRVEDRYASAREAIADLVELLKSAPSLPDGERSIRARVARALGRLYPAEPARSRADFARLLGAAKVRLAEAKAPSPEPVEPPGTPATLDAAELGGTRYRLVRELGRGGMGVVYEAKHVDLGRSVALKVLHPERSESVALAERFRKEARAIAALSHPNLVGLYDFGLTADGRPYTAMELLKGETLDHKLAREKRLDWRTAAELGVQVCAALEVAHKAGVIHRDVKPGNLFLTEEGTLKLLDFGIAKVVHDALNESSGQLVFGTPEYMAPEQSSGTRVDERSDLYALGVVLHELCSGGLPDRGPNVFPASAQRAHGALCLRLPRGTPTMLEATIQRATERDPEQRLQNAADMRAALEAALREPERSRQRRRRIAYVALGVIGLAILGGTVYGAENPELRTRAFLTVKPALDQISRLRGRANPVVVAQAEPARHAELAAAPRAPETPIEKPAEPARAATGAQPTKQAAQMNQGDDDGETDESAASEEPKVEEAKANDAKPVENQANAAGSTAGVEAELGKAQELMQQGQRLKAYHQAKQLAKRHGQDPRVLKTWCETAVATRSLGEAYRVAKRWVAAEKTSESLLELARRERALGKRSDAIKTVNQVIKTDPQSEDARHLLETLSNGQPKVARN